MGLLSAKADSLEDAKIAAEQPQGYLSAAVPLLGQVGAAGTSKDQVGAADQSEDQVGAADPSEQHVAEADPSPDHVVPADGEGLSCKTQSEPANNPGQVTNGGCLQ